MKGTLVLHTRYPFSSIFTYNAVTVLHFLLGGIGLIFGYPGWLGYTLGTAYLIFAFVEMYILMPLTICPNCPYYSLENSLCIAGMNVFSRKIAKEGKIQDFPGRAKGFLCHNNIYIAGFTLPIIAVIPALIISFSYVVLGIMLAMVGLLAFRFFVLFPKIACGHCRAQNICPNALAMGLGKH